MQSLFHKNGKPYFSIGAQVRNSSTASQDDMEKAWQAAGKLGVNTVAVSVHWQSFEPQEGEFCYSQIDMLLKGAKIHGRHMTVLWFGAWKNGTSQYAPVWVKKQKERFIRVQTAQHKNSMVLSPLCRETCEAESKAFQKLMTYIRDHDKEGVVLGVQVENEPGQLGSPRDYSEIGEQYYQSYVPDNIIQWLKQIENEENSLPDTLKGRESSLLLTAWRENGRREKGKWRDIFGFYSEEVCTASAFAAYINRIASAGREVCEIPFYVNVWLGEMYNRVPGIDYPSGGAVTNMIELWKLLTPQIHAICPDVYFHDFRSFDEVCRKYARNDNCLFIPETGRTAMNAVNIFYGIAHLGLSGVHCFGLEDMLDGQGEIKPEYREYAHTVKIISKARPLIEAYQGTGNLYAVSQYEGSAAEFYDFGDFIGRAVCMNPLGDAYSDGLKTYMDVWHEDDKYTQVRAKGIIVYEGNGSFYLAGEGFRLNLIRKDTVENMTAGTRTSNFQNLRHQEYVELSEGHFDEKGEYVADRIRTGDESDYGIWVQYDVGIVHAVLDLT